MNKLASQTVMIPTKLYLQKYISAWYGNPFHLNNQTIFGTLIICLLDKANYSTGMSTTNRDLRISHMNTSFECIIPIVSTRYKNYELSDDKVIAINRVIETQFDQELMKWCAEKKQNRLWRPGIDKAINSFCDIYGIDLESDISFDALKQREYRYRTRAKTFFQPNVASQNPAYSS